MAIDFPTSPATNDIYTYNGRTWKFNGSAWDFTSVNYTTTFSNANFVAATETVNIVASSATGTVNIDALTASAWYYTSNASANFTLNFRGNSGTALSSILAVGESMTFSFLNTNGTTAYYANVIQIDGSTTNVVTDWQNGIAPVGGNPSGTDVYSFSVIKTSSSTTPHTYLILGTQVKFA
jgi:hypothetical protein